VMEAAARGAKRSGGVTVGVIKGEDRYKSNDFTDVEVVSGMSADGFDEFLIVAMCDGLIALGGGAGTPGNCPYRGRRAAENQVGYPEFTGIRKNSSHFLLILCQCVNGTSSHFPVLAR